MLRRDFLKKINGVFFSIGVFSNPLMLSSSDIKRNLTIEEFCKKHSIPDHVCNFLKSKHSSMQDVWENCDDHDIWLKIATQNEVFPIKEIQFFCLFSIKEIENHINDKRIKNTIKTIENYLNFKSDKIQLQIATQKAYAACYENVYSQKHYAVYAAASFVFNNHFPHAFYAAAYSAKENESLVEKQKAYFKNIKPNFK